MTAADWARMEEELEDPEDKAEREAFQRKQEAKFAAAKSGTPAGFDMEAFNRAKTDEERQMLLDFLEPDGSRLPSSSVS